MSENIPRSNPRLDNFEANKAAYERKQFEEALYDEAGTTDFSDEARKRVTEADEYEQHLKKLASSDGSQELDRPKTDTALEIPFTKEQQPAAFDELQNRLQELRDALTSSPESGMPTPVIDTDKDLPPPLDDIEVEELEIRPDPSMLNRTILTSKDTWPGVTTEIGGSTTRVEYNEAEQMFSRVEIRGDGDLTPELLEKAGLMPHHRLEVEGSTIWFSHGYDIGGGRIAAVGYVQDDSGSIVARSYYRSNSQGVWRYLPQYQAKDGKVSWYSKGHGEESVTLPAALQEGLTRSIDDDGGVLELDAQTAQTAFIGTARRLGSEGTVYHRMVNEYPRKLQNIPETHGHDLPNPENIQPTPEQAPNFDTKLASWQQDTDLYGQVTFEVVASGDNTLRYVFCRDERGRAWVSGIENNSPLESTGLRTRWVSGGALTTPAYEYARQAGSFGNEDDQQGHYVDMFEHYLSKIPVIQEYLASAA